MASCRICPAIAGFGFADTASVRSGALKTGIDVSAKLGTFVGLTIGGTMDVAVTKTGGTDVGTAVGEPDTTVGAPPWTVGEPVAVGIGACASAPLTAMSRPMKTARNGTARSI